MLDESWLQSTRIILHPRQSLFLFFLSSSSLNGVTIKLLLTVHPLTELSKSVPFNWQMGVHRQVPFLSKIFPSPGNRTGSWRVPTLRLPGACLHNGLYSIQLTIFIDNEDRRQFSIVHVSRIRLLAAVLSLYLKWLPTLNQLKMANVAEMKKLSVVRTAQ